MDEPDMYRPKHFLLIAYPAFGHVTPLLELARKLSELSNQITFAVSENLITDMRSKKMITPLEEQQFHLTGLKDGVSHDLDEDFSSKALARLLDRLEPKQRDLIATVPTRHEQIPPWNNPSEIIDAVIIDLCCAPAAVPLCKQRGLPVYAFSAFAGFYAQHFFAIQESTPTLPDEMLLKPPEPGYSTQSLKYNDMKIKYALLRIDGVLFNSFEAFEPTLRQSILASAPEFNSVPFHFVGPLLPTEAEKAKDQTACGFCPITTWLNRQKDRSVIYISFGTIAKLDSEQVRDIAECLLSLKRPFIWSIRAVHDCHILDALQQAVVELLKNSSTLPYLIISWAPQKTILAHKATRLFVSHAGWNSTLEGVTNGVPFVAWPFFSDQHSNAELIVRSKSGVMVPGVDMTAPRLVSQGELASLISRVAQWDRPLTENSYFAAAQKLREEVRQATSSYGNSFQTLSSLSTGFL